MANAFAVAPEDGEPMPELPDEGSLGPVPLDDEEPVPVALDLELPGAGLRVVLPRPRPLDDEALVPVPLDVEVVPPEMVGVVDPLPLEADWAGDEEADPDCVWPVPLVLGLAPIVVEVLLPWPWEGVVLAGLDEPVPWLLEPDGWDPAVGGVGEELTAPDWLEGADAAELYC